MNKTDLTVNVSRSYSIGFHARWMDILLCGGHVEFVGLPKCLVGSSRSPREFYLNQVGLDVSPERRDSELAWAWRTVLRFYRDYCRTLLLCFPRLKSTVCQIEFPEYNDVLHVISQLKSFCLCPMGRLLETPDTDLDLPFNGKPRRYLRRVLGRPNRKTLVFATTVLQLKRVADKVPESFVSTALEKHRDAMLKPRRQPVWFIDLVSETAGSFTKGYLWDPKDEEEITDFSLNSCVESTRKNRGIYGYFERAADLEKLGRPEWFRPVIHKVEIRNGFAHSYHARVNPTYGDLKELMFRQMAGEGLQRRVVAVCEPLKVRVITIHHAFESPLWADFQKTLSRHLSRQEWCLTGEEFSVENFDFDLAIGYFEQAGYVPVIVSDDASAATDSIDVMLSQSVASDLIGDTWQEYMWQSWLGNLDYKSEGYSVQQNTGQLMGDRRSFPLLCLIHASAKRAFLDKMGVPRRFQKFYVNGDDGLIILPRVWLGDYFEFMANLWDLNPLKSYVHDRYFSFNSTFFDYKKRSQLPIIRWNLIAGVDKNGKRGVDPSIWNCVREDALPSHEAQLWSFFIGNEHWRKTLAFLDSKSRGANWHAPRSIGGYGLRRTREIYLNADQYYSLLVVMERIRDGLSIGKIASKQTANTVTVSRTILGGKVPTTAKRVEGTKPFGVKPQFLGTKLMVGRLLKSPDGSVAESHDIPDVLWSIRDIQVPLGFNF